MSATEARLTRWRRLQDPVPNIRFNVAKTLQAVATKVDASAVESAVKPCLESLLQDGDNDVVYFASRALASVTA